MPCGVWKTTDIPPDQVGRVIAAYRADSPNSVDKTQRGDGKWTVTATFDPCPAGQPQTTTQQHGG